MALQNFIAHNLPTIKAVWLNAVDVLKFTVFADAATKAAARTAIQLDPQLVATGVDSGAANAAVVTINGPLDSYVRATGSKVSFTPTAVNTGATTLNVNGGGAAAVVAADGSACTGGELSVPVTVEWTGAVWRIVSGSIPLAYRRTTVETSNAIVPTNYTRLPGDVLRYGTNTTPGTTNMTAAFTAARTAANSRYFIPDGTYLVDVAPDVWSDNFTAGGSAFIKIGVTTYTVSNAFAGRLRYRIASNVKTDIVDAVTDNIVMYLQNSQPGTATGFYRVLALQVDGHWAQVSPATNGSSVDLLWQRSPLNADPAGNRFNFTFDETLDRLDFSYATTASGAPAFDSWMQVVAGTSPSLLFPGLMAQFNQGLSVKQRAAGGYEFKIEQTSSTQAKFIQVGGSATNYMTFRDGAFGFFGSTGTSQQTVTGSRGGNAALASLLTALNATGLIIDGSTA